MATITITYIIIFNVRHVQLGNRIPNGHGKRTSEMSTKDELYQKVKTQF